MVGEGGLEPPHTHIYRILRPTRLPFRHSPNMNFCHTNRDDLDIITLNQRLSQAFLLNLSQQIHETFQSSLTSDIVIHEVLPDFLNVV